MLWYSWSWDHLVRKISPIGCKPHINSIFFKTRDLSVFLPTYLTGTYHKNLGFIYVHVDKKVTFWHVHTKKFICLGTWISLGRVNGDIHRRVSTITKVNMAMCGAQYVTLHIKIGWRKVKPCKFGPAKWLWPSSFVQFAEACESQTLAKEECNRYELTVSLFVIAQSQS